MSDPDMLRGVRVVVVEDDEDARALVCMRLRRFGADVTEVSTAADAMAAVARVKPHVLVSDIGLPGEDGLSLIRRVRALKPHEGRYTPAAAMTASPAELHRVQAFQAGFEQYVSKPVEPTQLVAIVANLAREGGYLG